MASVDLGSLSLVLRTVPLSSLNWCHDLQNGSLTSRVPCFLVCGWRSVLKALTFDLWHWTQWLGIIILWIFMRHEYWWWPECRCFLVDILTWTHKTWVQTKWKWVVMNHIYKSYIIKIIVKKIKILFLIAYNRSHTFSLILYSRTNTSTIYCYLHLFIQLSVMTHILRMY